MLLTPVIELQLLDRFELIDRVLRAELQARNAEALLKMERERVAEASAMLAGAIERMESAADVHGVRCKRN